MNKEEAINEILSNFDFELTTKMMKLHDTFWANCQPNPPRALKELCEAYLLKVCEYAENSGDSKSSTIGTAGMEWECTIEDGEYYLSQKFIGEYRNNFI